MPPSPPARPRGAARALLAGTTLLAGCAVGPDFKAPTPPSPPRLTRDALPADTVAAGGAAQRLTPGRDVAAAWWTLFRSPEVTGLVVQALARNPSLEQARQTLRQAQETAIASESGFLPSLGGQLYRQRNQYSYAQGGAPGSARTFSLYGAQLNVAYTFDVWGQTRRTVEANRAQAEAQAFAYLGAANILAANVVTAAVTAAGLTAQIEAETRLIAAERDLLARTRAQFEAGAATGLDLATQESQLATTEALLPPLARQREQALNQLAAYLGEPPAAIRLPMLRLEAISLPAELPVSLPSSLVAHRPDVRAAEAQLHAATAGIGIARANRLPQITLSASVGSLASTGEALFTPGTGIWSIANQALQPIFQGGQLLHQERAARAQAEAAAANWRNTVVTAFQNVADALNAVTLDAETLAAQEHAEAAARRSLDLARLQYGAGGAAYLSVLTAEVQYQNAAIALERARAARLADSAALFAALGGGWWNRADLPPPPESLLRSLLP